MARSVVVGALFAAFIVVAVACVADPPRVAAAPAAHAEGACGALSSAVIAPDSPQNGLGLLPSNGNVIISQRLGPGWSLIDAIDPPPKPAV